METWTIDLIWIALTAFLVILNGFFVAAEFALVKLRPSQLVALKRAKTPFAGTAEWLMQRLDRALSCCQLGITMASLGLGWVGEPAIARLLHPLFEAMHITSEAVIHTLAFIIAFTIITAAHLVLGEQAPKIFAIRRPEKMALWCAVPLKWFYLASYPLLMGLNAATGFLLRFVGIEGVSDHDSPHSEEEIRALLSQSHVHGELTRSEHRLLNAVFEFDDIVCRQIMVPRVEVEWIDAATPLDEVIDFTRRHRHTRYPVCEGSMDSVVGFIHLKDLLGVSDADGFDLRSIIRPPKYVPETVAISRLLAHFRGSRQHIAFVIDEYGSVGGIVTLENVLEQIVGSVQDEFDVEPPSVVPDGPGRFIVLGSTQIDAVNKVLEIGLAGIEVDTLSGLLMEQLGRVAAAGDRVELDGVTAEVIDIRNALPHRVRLVRPGPEDAAADA